DQISRLHHGQSADVEIVGPDANVQAPARGVPLLGITADERPRRIEIMAGKPDGPHVRHSVPTPTHVRAADWNDGVSAALEIEGEDGVRTLVLVGPAEQLLAPGMITDGLYERGP